MDNLLSGLIGAVLGFVGAVLLQWLETRRTQRAAVRAVFFEVAANSARLEAMIHEGRYLPVSNAVWLTDQTRIAQALSPADLVVVATYYMRIGLMRDLGGAGSPSEAVRSVGQNVFRRGEEAARILEARGWWRWERKNLEDRLTKFREEE